MFEKLKRRVLCALLAFVALSASAYDFELDGICYDVVSFTDFTCKVVKNNSNPYSGDVTIPDVVTYNTKELKVTEIGKEAFKNCSKLDNVVIGNNVTSIGDYAFSGSTLEEIKFGENVAEIGSSAFYNCKKLVKVILDDSLKTIGNYAFSGTVALTDLILPEGVEIIGDGCFSSSGITSIEIPASVTTLGKECFEGASELTTVKMLANLQTIPYECFRETKKLSSFDIPASVETIWQYAFYLSGINEITGGDNVRLISDYAFGSTPLKTLTLGPSIKQISSYAFTGSSAIRTINSYMPIVPELLSYNNGVTNNFGELFSSKVYTDAILNVLVGSTPQYENADQWKNFWNIQPTIENTLNIFSFNVYGTVTSGNGKLLINGEDAARIAVKGDSPAVYTFVPAFGYKLTELILNGEDVLDKVEGNSFKVDKITETTYLRATYTSTPVNFTIASGDQGSVTTSVPYGSTVDCIIKSLDGWKINTVTFNGNIITPQIGSDGKYSTPALTLDGTLAVSYVSTSSDVRSAFVNPDVKVIPSVGSISITGASEWDLVEVFDTAGKKLESTYAKEIPLSSGMYIVKVGGTTFKVAL